MKGPDQVTAVSTLIIATVAVIPMVILLCDFFSDRKHSLIYSMFNHDDNNQGGSPKHGPRREF